MANGGENIERQRKRRLQGTVQPGSGVRRDIEMFGSKVEKGYLKGRPAPASGGRDTAVEAILKVRGRRSPSTIRDE